MQINRNMHTMNEVNKKKSNWEIFQENCEYLPYEQRVAIETFLRDSVPQRKYKKLYSHMRKLDKGNRYLIDLVHEKGETYGSISQKIKEQKGELISTHTIARALQRCDSSGLTIEYIAEILGVSKDYFNAGIVWIKDSRGDMQSKRIASIKRKRTEYILTHPKLSARVKMGFEQMPPQVQDALIQYVKTLILISVET